jgi:hypothetical protein
MGECVPKAGMMSVMPNWFIDGSDEVERWVWRVLVIRPDAEW